MKASEASKILEQLTPKQRMEVLTASQIIRRYCKSDNEAERQAVLLFQEVMKERS